MVSKDLSDDGVFWLLTKLAGLARAPKDTSGNKEFAHKSVDVASISDSKAAEVATHVNGSGLARREL